MLLATLLFLAPAAVIAAAVVAFRGPGQRPAETLRFAETATLAAFAVAVASAAFLVIGGAATSRTFGFFRAGPVGPP